jgi:hypothetical protein
MSCDIACGNPRMLENLALINLIECPCEDNGPDCILFRRGIDNKFVNLKSLHLCKLADLE